MIDWIDIVTTPLWFGFAAIGFAVLFNVPQRTLVIIFCIAVAAGAAKMALLHIGLNIVITSFLAAAIVGLLSVPAAHNKHAPPLVFSIPAVIPLIPGVLAYQTMLGLMTLSASKAGAASTQVLSETISDGLKVMFILVSLSAGVALPLLLSRRESAKHVRLTKLFSEGEE